MKKRRRPSWFLKIGIHFICILMLFLTLASRYIFYEEGGEWETILVYQDSSALQIVIPFFFFWIVYSFIKSRWLKNIVRILLLGISGYILFLNLIAMVIPVQDYVPDIGAFAMSSLFPSLALLFLVEIFEGSKQEDKSLEEILDA